MASNARCATCLVVCPWFRKPQACVRTYRAATTYSGALRAVSRFVTSFCSVRCRTVRIGAHDRRLLRAGHGGPSVAEVASEHQGRHPQGGPSDGTRIHRIHQIRSLKAGLPQSLQRELHAHPESAMEAPSSSGGADRPPRRAQGQPLLTSLAGASSTASTSEKTRTRTRTTASLALPSVSLTRSVMT